MDAANLLQKQKVDSPAQQDDAAGAAHEGVGEGAGGKVEAGDREDLALAMRSALRRLQVCLCSLLPHVPMSGALACSLSLLCALFRSLLLPPRMSLCPERMTSGFA